MMKSICLNCLVYTLKDKEVKDNLYLNIFYIWLGKVIQSGGLTSNDFLQVIMDSRTVEYFSMNDTPLPMLLEKLQCPYIFHTFEPPTTILEGMMRRFTTLDYHQDIYLYCDIDILISRSLHYITDNLKDNTLYVCKEGYLCDENYSAGFSDSVENTSMPGFSSGKFIILGKGLRNSFFDKINSICDYSTDYYTKDQPFFNRVIYMLPSDKISVDTNLLTEYVSLNGYDDYNKDYNKDKTIFNDMAGDVANGESHVKRIMNTLSLYLAGFY